MVTRQMDYRICYFFFYFSFFCFFSLTADECEYVTSIRRPQLRERPLAEISYRGALFYIAGQVL